jgi:hypothetical protein
MAARIIDAMALAFESMGKKSFIPHIETTSLTFSPFTCG